MRKFFFLSFFLAIVSSLSAQTVFKPIEGEFPNYNINGYSSNGKYIVGDIPHSISEENSIGFIYNFEEGTLTKLPSPENGIIEESFANGVTPEGTIIVGAFRDPNYTVNSSMGENTPLKVAGYYKNGIWNSLGLGDIDDYKESFTDLYTHGSHATGISDDGKIIVGYIADKTSNSRPCAWILNDNGVYEYTSYQLPEDIYENYATITDISGDGSIAVGTYNVINELGEPSPFPVIWISPSTPISITDFEYDINTTNSFVISDNGKYGAISVTLVDLDEEVYHNKLYLYNVDNHTISPAEFGQNTPIVKGISNDGLMVGYDYFHQYIPPKTFIITAKAYIYSPESGSMEFYDYIKANAPELEEVTAGRGFAQADALHAQILGVSANGKTFIGRDQAMSIGILIFQSAFTLTIDNEEPSEPITKLTFEDLAGTTFTENTTIGIFTFAATSSANWSVDTSGNSAFTDGESYTARLKSGGVSTSDGRYITIACPSAGTVKIAARSSNSTATNRLLIGTFNGETILSQSVKDADKVGNSFPIFEVEVKQAGELKLSISSTDGEGGGVNFYCIEFEESDTPGTVPGLTDFSKEYTFINGYSSNGRYVVGQIESGQNAGFIFDAETGIQTTLGEGTKAYGVTKDGSIVVGSFTDENNDSRQMAGYYKDGTWTALPIPADLQDAFTSEWHGTVATSISNDGTVISGYFNLDVATNLGAWYLNEETGEYEFTLFTLPEDNFNNRGIMNGVSGNGKIFYGSYTKADWTTYPLIWGTPDAPVIVGSKKFTTNPDNNYSISNNGKYVTVETNDGSVVYYVETGEIVNINFTEEAGYSSVVTGISDDQLVVGYLSDYSTYVPYVYSEESGNIDLQTYLSTNFPELAQQTTGLGFSSTDEESAQLLGISSNANRFIGTYNFYSYTHPLTGFPMTDFEDYFVLATGEADKDNDDEGPSVIYPGDGIDPPQPKPEAPADPITVDPLLDAEYRVSNYSSNANYLVGDASGYGFVYNVESKQLTQLTTVNTSTVKAVSNDGNVVVGSINYSTGTETVVFKNGEYVNLSSGDQEVYSINLYGVSDDGNIIVGYVYTTDNQSVPCKWIYNNETQEYTYFALPIPTGVSNASAHSISADGTVIVGTGSNRTIGGEIEGKAILWQNNTPKVLTEGLDLLEVSSSRISSNGKYAIFNLFQKVEEDYLNLASIYDVEKDELNTMAFLTDADLVDYPQFEQVMRSAFSGISDTGIAFGQVVLFGGFESEGSTMMIDYIKPYVYHPELGAVSLYEYIQKNDTELLRNIIGYGIDMNENLIGTETIGISADGESFITKVSDPLKSIVLDIEYTFEKPGNSIDTESTAKVSVYPNPATDYINIDGEIVKASLISIEGQIVLEKTENQISVSSLPQGTYFLKVETVDGVYTQKVIIKK